MLMLFALPIALLWWGLLVLWPLARARRRGRRASWITLSALGLSVAAMGAAAVAWPRDVVVAGLLPVPTAILWWMLAEQDLRPASDSLYPLSGPAAATCPAEPPALTRTSTQDEVKAAVADMIRESAGAGGEVDWDCVVSRFSAWGEEAWVVYHPAAGTSLGYDTLRFTLAVPGAWDEYRAVPGGPTGIHTAVILRSAEGDVGLVNWHGDQRTTPILGSTEIWDRLDQT